MGKLRFLGCFMVLVGLVASSKVTMEGNTNAEEMSNTINDESRKELELLLRTGKEAVWQQGWPRSSVRRELGQVAGVAMDSAGQGYIFHRADQQWQENDFNSENEFTRVKNGAIKKDTIMVVGSNGNLIRSFGKDIFFMPHGITVDHQGSIWVTDVALHQVLKFNKDASQPSLVIGEKFVPGTDARHFCKPTKVVVAKNGDFFVADGYCNARIMKFNKFGVLKKQWGRDADDDSQPGEDEFLIPHGLTLDEENDVLCVADREHRRAQCFRAGLNNEKDTGRFVSSVQESDFGRVMDVAFVSGGRYLLVLSVPDGSLLNDVESRGFFYDTLLRTTVNFFSFRPANDNEAYVWGFGEGHTLGASPKGDAFLVGSLVSRCNGPAADCFGLRNSSVPYSVWRFGVRLTNQLSGV